MKEVAVIGGGMTMFRRHLKETGKELSYYAAKMAMEDAGITKKDIDMVVMGSAPDAFDGVHLKGENLLDGAAAGGKPYVRVFNGGGTGVFAPIAGWWHVASGVADICLVVCEEKMGNCYPHPQTAFRHIWDPILDRPLNPNLVWLFAMEYNRYMNFAAQKMGISVEKCKEWIAEVAVKNKRNAVGHPCAQLADPNITVKDVLESEIMAWPVNRLDISPPSDGAAALIYCSKDVVHKFTDDPIYVGGVGWNIDSTMWTNRDLYFPRYVANAAKMCYKKAGINNPTRDIDFAEPYDPFTYKELHHMEGMLLCEKGEAAKMTHEGETQRDGRMPICPSGGLLGVGNPIAATMGQKVCELYWQLAGKAGKRQIPGDPRVGVGMAWGDIMQMATVIALRRG
ncbi:MAG: thiolase domain-containing protein [Desulfobacteraceae bacterium]|nr:thiolase domain-containing protein [Desulfobacteraceae bacterium]